MRKRLFIILIVSISSTLYNCKGTINTVKYSQNNLTNFKKAYIISSENSEYIKFRFGEFTYGGYMAPDDDPAEKINVIGNTDTIIKRELEKYGIYAVIGKKGDVPENFDFIVKYKDTWRWDFKNILDELEISFISPNGNKVLATSIFTIYKNKEIHNFPSPEKEVPKMIKELLGKK